MNRRPGSESGSGRGGLRSLAGVMCIAAASGAFLPGGAAAEEPRDPRLTGERGQSSPAPAGKHPGRHSPSGKKALLLEERLRQYIEIIRRQGPPPAGCLYG